MYKDFKRGTHQSMWELNILSGFVMGKPSPRFRLILKRKKKKPIYPNAVCVFV